MLATRLRLRRAIAWVSARVDRFEQLFCNDSLRHERLILDFYGFRPFDSTAKSFVAGEIEKLARSQLQPALILWRIVDSLVKEKIEIPGYYPLAELILAAVNTRKAELCAIIEPTLTRPRGFGGYVNRKSFKINPSA